MKPMILFSLATLMTFIFTLTVTFPEAAHAEDGWKHESELAVVTTSGNSESESYAGKQKTSYEFVSNVLTATGKYLQTKSFGVESAKSWDAGLRYDRVLTDQWSVYVGAAAESNYLSGFIQKNSAEAGGKYTFYKNDNSYLFTEVGYRTTKTQVTEVAATIKSEDKNEQFGRVYAEYSQQVTATSIFKLWAEHLPNLTNSSGALTNVEASVRVALSDMFSLKTAYLQKTDNNPKAGLKKTDSTLTTSLVAKF